MIKWTLVAYKITHPNGMLDKLQKCMRQSLAIVPLRPVNSFEKRQIELENTVLQSKKVECLLTERHIKEDNSNYRIGSI